MEWIQADIETSSAGVEIVSAVLAECGVVETQITDDGDMRAFLENNPDGWDYIDDDLMNAPPRPALVTFYVAANPPGGEILTNVKNSLIALREAQIGLDLGALVLTSQNVDDDEWLTAWKKYYKPFRVGERLVVRPYWEEYVNTGGDTVFTINPGNVFGTGLHETTRLCLEQVEKTVKRGDNILDAGCGSGILGLCAMLLFEDVTVTACDIDAGVVEIVNENALLNAIDPAEVNVLRGNLLTDAGTRATIAEKRYDVILANIVADVIIAATTFFAEVLKDGGALIASGIIAERLGGVTEALAANGFDVAETTERGSWYAVKAIKP